MDHQLYLELMRYARVLFGRKRLLISVALAVTTFGFVLSYVVSKEYEAQSTVFIEQSVINDLVSGIAVTPSMDAKIKVLTVSMLSRDTLSRVLRVLDKDVILNSETEFEKYLERLRQDINVKLDEKRGIFFISFRDPDPRYARDLVNTLTQVYIETNTASKREESLAATRFLGEQIEGFKKRIDDADEEINRYKAQHGMQLAVDETVIRFEIAEAQKKLEEIRARRVELEAQARILSSGGGNGNPLADMERALAVLRQTYTENHPKVIRLKAEIDAFRQRPTIRNSAGGGTSMSKAMVMAELEASKRYEKSSLREIEEKTDLLRKLPVIRSGLNELLRRKENESQIYNQLVTRYGQSEVSKQMEIENKAMTFRIIDPAVEPNIPVSPNRPLIMLGSLAAGLGAGVALILVPYMMGGAVKRVADLRIFNQRVLAVLPIIPKPAEELQRRKSDRIFLAGALAYFSVLLVLGILEVMRKTYVEDFFALFF